MKLESTLAISLSRKSVDKSTKKFDLGFQKFFIVNGLAIKFFFHTNASFILNIFTLFLIILHLQSKNTSIKLHHHHNFLHMRSFLEELW